MTGGARGRCNPATAGTIPPYTGSYSYGRGLGLRRGFRGRYGPGHGRGRGYGRKYGGYPFVGEPAVPVDTDAEIDMLKAQADSMKNSLDAINSRIAELGEKTADES
jgi:hypothetical protein